MTTRKKIRIDRLAAGSRDVFLAEYRLQQPVVLSGGLKNRSGVLFDMELLARRFGAFPVLTYKLASASPVRRMSAHKANFYEWSDEHGDREHLRNWTFGEFLAALCDGGAHYCMANRSKNKGLRDLLVAEAGKLDCPVIGGEKLDPDRCEFFFGSRDTGPGLHHDGAAESFLCQLIGAKRVNAFSPMDIAYLYPAGSWLAPRGHFSAVADSFRPDTRKFPLFARAIVHGCRLDPGDVLYLPPHWYHDPCPTEPSAMMTIRDTAPKAVWGTVRSRESLQKAASSFFRSLKKFSLTAQAVYSARLAHDLKQELRSLDRQRKLKRRCR